MSIKDKAGEGREVDVSPKATTSPSIVSNAAERGGYMTFTDVEQRMVEAVRQWWRTPGQVGPGSGSPFASDIPAELIVKDGSDGMPAWAGDGVDGVSSTAPLRSAAMTRADIAERDVATEWLMLVPERDRRLVSMALRQLAAGRRQISWKHLLRPMNKVRGADGLRKRYSRAISGIARQLNRRKSEGRDGQDL